MDNHNVALARTAKAMTRKEVMLKAIQGRLTWLQAADICGITARQMRRLKTLYEKRGFDGLQDMRGRSERHPRIPISVIAEVIRLKRELYADFSIAHFHDFITEKHGIAISEKWTAHVLQDAGLVEKAPARGKHRRRRERRPMRGMLLHLDASTHAWVEGRPKADLMLMLDDANGDVVYACFVKQEGTVATLRALEHVLRTYGRFCELYTDRGSHFCTTTVAAAGPDLVQRVQVGRCLKTLGIRHILARSPQARGRSERAFGTFQGRLPQELKLAKVHRYRDANVYLNQVFVPDFRKRFTVAPAEPESAFTPLAGMNLDMLLSLHHERIVRNDNTVSFKSQILQLPAAADRMHYVRCPVTVHEFLNGTLGLSYQSRVLARYDRDGQLLNPLKRVVA